MANLFGTGPNQISPNGLLGNLAFQDKAYVSVDKVGIGTTFVDSGTSGQILQVYGGGAYVSGSVGIGTTNPSQPLDVLGNIRVRSGLYDFNNQVGTAGSVLTSTGIGVSWANVSLSGAQGAQGTQGIQGLSNQGTQGTQGTQGIQGLSNQGAQGAQGIQGLQGVQGRQGTQGTQGIQGLSNQGTQGLQGTQGVGSQGLQGATGSGGVSAWSRKTTTYTAVAGDRLIADTSGGAFTITLPATPTTGNSIVFADGADWETNNLTVARNSSTIEGVADDFVLDIKGIEVEFVYDGTTWEVFAYTGPAGPNNIINATNDTTSTILYPVMVSDAGINTTAKVTTTTNYLTFDATTGQITAIDFNSASDKNLKTNVIKLNNSIETIKKLSPVSFNWKTTGEKSYGLIAQEVEKILPELVSETNGVKSVRYIPLIAMLIDAIVELEKRIPNE